MGWFKFKFAKPNVVGDKGDADIQELINKLENKSFNSHTEEEEDEGMDADIGGLFKKKLHEKKFIY